MGFDIQIRVSTLKRAGSHAIINWISSLYDINRVLFVNDMILGRNPLHKSKYNNIPNLNGKYRSGNEDIIIFGREDAMLDDVRDSISEPTRIKWFGEGEAFDVIIIRDSLNCFAGKWALETNKMPNYHPSIINKFERPYIVNMWKQYAYEFLSDTHILPYKKIGINYNMWCVNPVYRQCIAGMFPQSNFDNEITNQVSGLGWGSSFDDNKELKQMLKNNDSRKRFSTRYKNFGNIPEFESFKNDKELMELSKTIFGIEY